MAGSDSAKQLDAAVDAATAFVLANSTFKSSRTISAVSDKMRAAITSSNVGSQAWALFQIPIREKILTFEKAMMWANFVANVPSLPALLGANGNPVLSLDAAFALINRVYDLAFEDNVAVHWFVEGEEEDEEDEEDDDAKYIE